MNAETLPSLTTAAHQLQEIEAAIQQKDYRTLQCLLLQQAVVLHEMGMVFIEKSTQQESLRYKRACIDLGLRSFGQSRKAMASIKSLELTKN